MVDVLMEWVGRQMEGYEVSEIEMEEKYEQMTLPFL